MEPASRAALEQALPALSELTGAVDALADEARPAAAPANPAGTGADAAELVRPLGDRDPALATKSVPNRLPPCTSTRFSARSDAGPCACAGLSCSIWIVGAIAAVTQLPSLSSVTQSNNAKFLPASAPSQHAIDLAAPFGNSNLLPIPVIAATPAGR